MIKTSGMMRTSPVCIRREPLIADAVELLLQNDIGGVPVVDCDRRLVGMFSETDHSKKSQSDREHAPVSTRTTKDPICVTANATVLDRAKNFCERNVHRLPVIVENGQVAGVLECRDFARTVRDLEHLVQELHQAVPLRPFTLSRLPIIWRFVAT